MNFARRRLTELKHGHITLAKKRKHGMLSGNATEIVQFKGYSYDHCSMLTVDMARELIEHSIITEAYRNEFQPHGIVEKNGEHAYDMLKQNLTAGIAQVSDSAFVRKTSGERGGDEGIGRRHRRRELEGHWPEASASRT